MLTPMVYAGIDEAGYGPLFGPLVITRCVFVSRNPSDGGAGIRGSHDEVEKHWPLFDDEPPRLWEALEGAVCRNAADPGSRLPVNDSKLLYRSRGGIGTLERSVLSFLAALGMRPGNLARLLELLALDRASSTTEQVPWYRDHSGWPALPGWTTPGHVDRGAEALTAAFDGAGVRLAEIRCAVVMADRFNRMVRETGNKASCSWHFVGGHLARVWEGFSAAARVPSRGGVRAGALVAIDRQGGRKSYGSLLRRVFPECTVTILGEDAETSRYRVFAGEHAMQVTVQVKGERRHLPVALASMVSKYVRELLMLRFRRYWLAQAPEVRPTSGYFRDGRRFLREIQPHFERLDIDPGLLVRER